MKILIINDSYAGIGGEKTYIKYLIDGLRQLGNEVYFLAVSREQKSSDNYYKIINYGFKNKWQWFILENLIDYKLYKKIKNHINTVNPDIIHFQNISGPTKTILFSSLGFSKIQTIHDYKLACPLTTMVIEKNNYAICSGKNKLKCHKNGCLKWQSNLFNFWLLDNNLWQKKIVNKFVCPSKKLLIKSQEYGYKNLVHLPNPIDLSARSFEIKKSNNVLFVGRLIKEKGVSYLLEAFKIALSKNNNLTLTIIGDGPEKKCLEKYCQNTNINKSVFFLGTKDQHTINKYYINSLVVVVPSILVEQFGLVVLEAMKYGKPVIGFDIGGLSELIKNHQNGFLVERFNIKDLADKIVFIYENPNVRYMINKNELEMVKKYDLKIYLKELTKIYENMIKK